MRHSTPTPASGNNVVPFLTRSTPPDPDPSYAHLGRLAAIRAAFAEATPAPHPGESEILELLRRIDRRLESQPTTTQGA